MLNTYTSYQLIARDITKSIDRVEKQPMVDRDTEYYLANITKVKSIDDFVKNDRLFKYAMKAYGLEDMDYAKAFMVKALKEGVTDPDSFANKLTDKRYAEFVAAFNFAAYGARCDRLQQGAARRHRRTTPSRPDRPASTRTRPVREGRDDLLPRQHRQREVRRRPDGQRAALHLCAGSLRPRYRRPRTRTSSAQVLQGGVQRSRTASPTSRTNKAYAGTGVRLQLRALRRERRRPINRGAADRPSTSIMRQTLEEDAGKTNEGVRLALYFERKAPDHHQLVRRAGRHGACQRRAHRARPARLLRHAPTSTSRCSCSRRSSNIADFTDPQKLSQVPDPLHQHVGDQQSDLDRRSTSVSVLFAQPTAIGISTDLMFAMQKLKF